MTPLLLVAILCFHQICAHADDGGSDIDYTMTVVLGDNDRHTLNNVDKLYFRPLPRLLLPRRPFPRFVSADIKIKERPLPRSKPVPSRLPRPKPVPGPLPRPKPVPGPFDRPKFVPPRPMPGPLPRGPFDRPKFVPPKPMPCTRPKIQKIKVEDMPDGKTKILIKVAMFEDFIEFIGPGQDRLFAARLGDKGFYARLPHTLRRLGFHPTDKSKAQQAGLLLEPAGVCGEKNKMSAGSDDKNVGSSEEVVRRPYHYRPSKQKLCMLSSVKEYCVGTENSLDLRGRRK